jgi:superfamily II DNA or RNA helicase
MRVVHGLWVRGALALWAEDGDARQPAKPKPGTHPFAVRHAELARSYPGASVSVLTLQLPTSGTRPVPSDGSDTGARKLVSWQVPALLFTSSRALELLEDPGAPRYLAAVARFAADLAERGKVLPVLVRERGGYAARWRPVLSGPDATHARDLAHAMPPLLRAAVKGDGEAGGTDAGAVLTDALQALTDAAARRSLPTGLIAARTSTIPERWIQGLTGTDAAVLVDGPAEESAAASLAGELDDWLATASAPSGPARVSFRLVEPTEEDEDDWSVELALQSAEDPSLLVPAADVWAGTSNDDWLGAGSVQSLLTGLGRAARLFPALQSALLEAAPTAVMVDMAGALAFLREHGPLLSGAGFGVRLPDWARKARLGLKLTTRSASPSPASVTAPKFGMADILEFKYEVAVGDLTLSEDELAELAAMKVPLVRLRGQWVELDDRHVKAALKFLERGRSGTMTAAEALNAGLHASVDGIPIAEVAADGWLGDLLSGEADRRLEPVPAPAGFHGTLRPYQERGLAWLSFLDRLGLGAVLADDMGLGKTIQLLSLAAASAGPTLLVCPMSLVSNWQREAARFTPDLRVHVYHGADRELQNADLVITTYQIAARDRDALAGVEWSRVVCDEAQNIKNHATRQAAAVRALPARSRIALTGTPVENRLSELWSIMDFTNPGLLGSSTSFRETFAIPVERHSDDEATARLARITGPFVLRRLKTDKSIIADLPDKQEIKVWCNLTPEQASLYTATVTDMMARIESAEEDIERRGLVLATMAKLKQVCNHPAHLLGDGSRLDGRSGKLARLEEICDEIVADGEKALCFTQYAEFGKMLRPYLEARLGCPVLFLYGGMSKKRRDEAIARFNALDEPAIFLLSLKAGGTGLNLTAANHVIHFDRWWNPAVEDQATDRAFRIGQQRDVQVRKFVCAGTLEERIDAMIEEKKALARRVIGTGESWVTSLSVAELRDVLALSPEAVTA